MENALVGWKQIGDNHLDAGRVELERSVGHNLGGDRVAVSARVMDDQPAIGIDDE